LISALEGKDPTEAISAAMVDLYAPVYSHDRTSASMSTTPHPPTTKYELMRRVQAEDTEAFGVLYDRLAPKALRVAYAVGVDRDPAQKAVQEAFCRSGVAARG